MRISDWSSDVCSSDLLRGDRISMVFQERMTSLNPLHNIEKQVNEVLILHKGLNAAAARTRTLELLRLVGIPDAEKRLGAYPHELSDRTSVVSGKSASVSGDHGGARIIQKKKKRK